MGRLHQRPHTAVAAREAFAKSVLQGWYGANGLGPLDLDPALLGALSAGKLQPALGGPAAAQSKGARDAAAPGESRLAFGSPWSV